MSKEGLALLLLVACFCLLAILEAAALRGRPRCAADTSARTVTNFGLGIAAMLASALPFASRLSASALSQSAGLGLASRWALGWAVTFCVLLLLQSLAAYWTHRLSHAVPLLWRVHRVHHADAHVDISTGLRNHPLELAVALPASAVVILLVGAPPSVVIAVDTLLFAAALWQHADFALPPQVERWIGQAIVTPAFHRTHHAPERRLHDGNYGDVLTLWDRLFGTAKAPLPRDAAIGLAQQRARPDHLIEQLLAPLHPLQAGTTDRRETASAA